MIVAMRSRSDPVGELNSDIRATLILPRTPERSITHFKYRRSTTAQLSLIIMRHLTIICCSVLSFLRFELINGQDIEALEALKAAQNKLSADNLNMLMTELEIPRGGFDEGRLKMSSVKTMPEEDVQDSVSASDLEALEELHRSLTSRKSISRDKELKNVHPKDGLLAKAAAAPTLSFEAKCNNEMLRRIILENINEDTSVAKREIQRAAAQEIGGRVDVICSKGVFSYIVNTEVYCEEESRGVTCFAFKQF
ncbi:hypothetical protein AB6A40_005620 [Gnathostoma spinigerum]|uniref:Ground-like domain-containing protein n=1 Tax=Gnathostoma spinigerum TaxID=75299 RepID=A0ABD6ENA7_9BILA